MDISFAKDIILEILITKGPQRSEIFGRVSLNCDFNSHDPAGVVKVGNVQKTCYLPHFQAQLYYRP
jgi:hypothetical protein